MTFYLIFDMKKWGSKNIKNMIFSKENAISAFSNLWDILEYSRIFQQNPKKYLFLLLGWHFAQKKNLKL